MAKYTRKERKAVKMYCILMSQPQQPAQKEEIKGTKGLKALTLLMVSMKTPRRLKQKIKALPLNAPARQIMKQWFVATAMVNKGTFAAPKKAAVKKVKGAVVLAPKTGVQTIEELMEKIAKINNLTEAAVDKAWHLLSSYQRQQFLMGNVEVIENFVSRINNLHTKKAYVADTIRVLWQQQRNAKKGIVMAKFDGPIKGKKNIEVDNSLPDLQMGWTGDMLISRSFAEKAVALGRGEADFEVVIGKGYLNSSRRWEEKSVAFFHGSVNPDHHSEAWWNLVFESADVLICCNWAIAVPKEYQHKCLPVLWSKITGKYIAEVIKTRRLAASSTEHVVAICWTFFGENKIGVDFAQLQKTEEGTIATFGSDGMRHDDDYNVMYQKENLFQRRLKEGKKGEAIAKQWLVSEGWNVADVSDMSFWYSSGVDFYINKEEQNWSIDVKYVNRTLNSMNKEVGVIYEYKGNPHGVFKSTADFYIYVFECRSMVVIDRRKASDLILSNSYETYQFFGNKGSIVRGKRIPISHFGSKAKVFESKDFLPANDLKQAYQLLSYGVKLILWDSPLGKVVIGHTQDIKESAAQLKFHGVEYALTCMAEEVSFKPWMPDFSSHDLILTPQGTIALKGEGIKMGSKGNDHNPNALGIQPRVPSSSLPEDLSNNKEEKMTIEEIAVLAASGTASPEQLEQLLLWMMGKQRASVKRNNDGTTTLEYNLELVKVLSILRKEEYLKRPIISAYEGDDEDENYQGMPLTEVMFKETVGSVHKLHPIASVNEEKDNRAFDGLYHRKGLLFDGPAIFGMFSSYIDEHARFSSYLRVQYPTRITQGAQFSKRNQQWVTRVFFIDCNNPGAAKRLIEENAIRGISRRGLEMFFKGLQGKSEIDGSGFISLEGPHLAPRSRKQGVSYAYQARGTRMLPASAAASLEHINQEWKELLMDPSVGQFIKELEKKKVKEKDILKSLWDVQGTNLFTKWREQMKFEDRDAMARYLTSHTSNPLPSIQELQYIIASDIAVASSKIVFDQYAQQGYTGTYIKGLMVPHGFLQPGVVLLDINMIKDNSKTYIKEQLKANDGVVVVGEGSQFVIGMMQDHGHGGIVTSSQPNTYVRPSFPSSFAQFGVENQFPVGEAIGRFLKNIQNVFDSIATGVNVGKHIAHLKAALNIQEAGESTFEYFIDKEVTGIVSSIDIDSKGSFFDAFWNHPSGRNAIMNLFKRVMNRFRFGDMTKAMENIGTFTALKGYAADLNFLPAAYPNNKRDEDGVLLEYKTLSYQGEKPIAVYFLKDAAFWAEMRKKNPSCIDTAAGVLRYPVSNSDMYSGAYIVSPEFFKQDAATRLFPFLKERTQEEFIEIGRMTLEHELEEHCDVVFVSNKGDHKYVFIGNRILDKHTLQIDDKGGNRVRGSEYHGIKIVGDYYQHPIIKDATGDNADVIVVDTIEEAYQQFFNYQSAGTKHLYKMSNASRTLLDDIVYITENCAEAMYTNSLTIKELMCGDSDGDSLGYKPFDICVDVQDQKIIMNELSNGQFNSDFGFFWSITEDRDTQKVRFAELEAWTKVNNKRRLNTLAIRHSLTDVMQAVGKNALWQQSIKGLIDTYKAGKFCAVDKLELKKNYTLVDFGVSSLLFSSGLDKEIKEEDKDKGNKLMLEIPTLTKEQRLELWNWWVQYTLIPAYQMMPVLLELAIMAQKKDLVENYIEALFNMIFANEINQGEGRDVLVLRQNDNDDCKYKELLKVIFQQVEGDTAWAGRHGQFTQLLMIILGVHIQKSDTEMVSVNWVSNTRTSAMAKKQDPKELLRDQSDDAWGILKADNLAWSNSLWVEMIAPAYRNLRECCEKMISEDFSFNDEELRRFNRKVSNGSYGYLVQEPFAATDELETFKATVSQWLKHKVYGRILGLSLYGNNRFDSDNVLDKPVYVGNAKSVLELCRRSNLNEIVFHWILQAFLFKGGWQHNPLAMALLFNTDFGYKVEWKEEHTMQFAQMMSGLYAIQLQAEKEIQYFFKGVVYASKQKTQKAWEQVSSVGYKMLNSVPGMMVSFTTWYNKQSQRSSNPLDMYTVDIMRFLASEKRNSHLHPWMPTDSSSAFKMYCEVNKVKDDARSLYDAVVDIVRTWKYKHPEKFELNGMLRIGQLVKKADGSSVPVLSQRIMDSIFQYWKKREVRPSVCYRSVFGEEERAIQDSWTDFDFLNLYWLGNQENRIEIVLNRKKDELSRAIAENNLDGFGPGSHLLDVYTQGKIPFSAWAVNEKIDGFISEVVMGYLQEGGKVYSQQSAWEMSGFLLKEYEEFTAAMKEMKVKVRAGYQRIDSREFHFVSVFTMENKLVAVLPADPTNRMLLLFEDGEIVLKKVLKPANFKNRGVRSFIPVNAVLKDELFFETANTFYNNNKDLEMVGRVFEFRNETISEKIEAQHFVRLLSLMFARFPKISWKYRLEQDLVGQIKAFKKLLTNDQFVDFVENICSWFEGVSFDYEAGTFKTNNPQFNGVSDFCLHGEEETIVACISQEGNNFVVDSFEVQVEEDIVEIVCEQQTEVSIIAWQDWMAEMHKQLQQPKEVQQVEEDNFLEDLLDELLSDEDDDDDPNGGGSPAPAAPVEPAPIPSAPVSIPPANTVEQDLLAAAGLDSFVFPEVVEEQPETVNILEAVDYNEYSYYDSYEPVEEEFTNYYEEYAQEPVVQAQQVQEKEEALLKQEIDQIPVEEIKWIQQGAKRWTGSQSEGIKKIRSFLDGDETAMVIEGYAGAGKTHCLTQGIFELHRQGTIYNGRKEKVSVVWAAPTWKAALVVQKMLKKQGRIDYDRLKKQTTTVASLFGFTTSEVNGKVHLRKHGMKNLKEKLDSIMWGASMSAKVVVIDESSMLDKVSVDYIIQEATRFNIKIIFVGDPLQLPPINGEQSNDVSLFTQSSTIFDTWIGKKAEFKQIVRYKGWKIKYANWIRKQSEACRSFRNSSALFSRDFVLPSHAEEKIEVMSQSEMQTRYFENQSDLGWIGDTVYLTYVNADRKQMNQNVRKLLAKDSQHRFNVGELIIPMKTYIGAGEHTLPNGKQIEFGTMFNSVTYQILKVYQDQEVEFIGYKVVMEGNSVTYQELKATTVCAVAQIKEAGEDDAETIWVPLLKSEDEESKKEKFIKYQKDQLQLFAKRPYMTKANWKQYWLVDEQINKMESSIPFVDYAFSSTIHKSQGSTYKRVFINVDSFGYLLTGKDQASREQFWNLFYTAFTRASEEVVFVTDRILTEEMLVDVVAPVNVLEVDIDDILG